VVATDCPTILDLLDTLEAALAAEYARRDAATISGDALRLEMSVLSLTPTEFASTFSVPERTVEEWLAGHAPAPGWAFAGVRLLALMTPSARRKILGRADPVPKAAAKQPHPFSRIEEL
jgi:hypothetical protein